MNTQMFMTLNLKDGSILLSKGVLNALDWPRQVQMMVNPSEKKLMLRACTVEDRDAVVVPDGQTEPFEISARLFMKKIREMVGWEDKLLRGIPAGAPGGTFQAGRSSAPGARAGVREGGREWTGISSSDI